MLFMKYIDKKDILDTSDATATEDDILLGKTAYVNGELITGVYNPLCKKLEYITANGTQYVDTGIINTHKISYEIKYRQIGKINHFDTLIGGADDNGGTFLMCTCDNSTAKKSLFYGSSENKVTPQFNYYDVDTIASLNENVYTFNNGQQEESFVVGDKTEFTTNSTLWLFTLNSNGTSYGPCHVMLFYCKIWNDGVLVRDYIPVKRTTDNAICLYDKVNHQFTLPLKGTLIAGPEL